MHTAIIYFHLISCINFTVLVVESSVTCHKVNIEKPIPPNMEGILEIFEPIFNLLTKGNLAVFESTNISETGETTPTKIGVHAFDINSYLHEFFGQIPIN